jgi:periplasmic divalent cation tolerance protein
MNPADYSVVLTTCSGDIGQRIAETLVSQNLAACVQSLPIQSTYRWKGDIETAHELLLLIKIKASDYTAVEDAIRALHSYDTPEIIALPVQQGFAGYLSWIADVTRR